MIDAELNRRCVFDQGFGKHKQINNSVFGECTILRDSSLQEDLMKSKVTNSKDEFISDLKILSLRKSLKHDNLVRLLDYSAKKKSDFCSTFFISNAFYEVFQTSLAD